MYVMDIDGKFSLFFRRSTFLDLKIPSLNYHLLYEGCFSGTFLSIFSIKCGGISFMTIIIIIHKLWILLWAKLGPQSIFAQLSKGLSFLCQFPYSCAIFIHGNTVCQYEYCCQMTNIPSTSPWISHCLNPNIITAPCRILWAIKIGMVTLVTFFSFRVFSLLPRESGQQQECYYRQYFLRGVLL